MYTPGPEQRYRGIKHCAQKSLERGHPLKTVSLCPVHSHPMGFWVMSVSEACQLGVSNMGIHLLLTRTAARDVPAAICWVTLLQHNRCQNFTIHNGRVFTVVKTQVQMIYSSDKAVLETVPSNMQFFPLKRPQDSYQEDIIIILFFWTFYSRGGHSTSSDNF